MTRLEQIRRRLDLDARDITGIAGFLLVAVGLWAVHWAAAAIVCGTLLLVGAVRGGAIDAARPPARPPEQSERPMIGM